MIVIIGESASGKSTLLNMFVSNNPSFHKIVTYTTRPPREGETDGVDYHFIPKDRYDDLVKNHFFVEHAQYRDWYYGTAREDCNSKYAIAVLTPAGLRALVRNDYDVISVYLKVDRRSRLISILSRGDNIDEAYRRNLSDVGQFDDVSNEVNYVIDNSEFWMNERAVLKKFESIVLKHFPEIDHKQITFFDNEMECDA